MSAIFAIVTALLVQINMSIIAALVLKLTINGSNTQLDAAITVMKEDHILQVPLQENMLLLQLIGNVEHALQVANSAQLQQLSATFVKIVTSQLMIVLLACQDLLANNALVLQLLLMAANLATIIVEQVTLVSQVIALRSFTLE